MAYSKFDILHLLMQPYVLDILRALKESPKRFVSLEKYVKNERTLALKLSKLHKYGLINVTPKLISGKYANHYALSKKGAKILTNIEKLL